MNIINRWSDGIECPENNPIYIGNPSDAIWTTKDNKKIRVGEMTDDHVRNCYELSKDLLNKYWQNVFRAEMKKRKIKF